MLCDTKEYIRLPVSFTGGFYNCVKLSHFYKNTKHAISGLPKHFDVIHRAHGSVSITDQKYSHFVQTQLVALHQSSVLIYDKWSKDAIVWPISRMTSLLGVFCQASEYVIGPVY